MGDRFGQMTVELTFELLPEQSNRGIEVFVFGLSEQLTIGDPDLCFNDECQALFDDDDLGGNEGHLQALQFGKA